MALDHPEVVKAIHINMFLALPPNKKSSAEKIQRYERNDYSVWEKKNLERTHWFATEEVQIPELTFRLLSLPK